MTDHRHYVDEIDGDDSHTHELGELGAAGVAETDELRTRADILERDRDDHASELEDLDELRTRADILERDRDDHASELEDLDERLEACEKAAELHAGQAQVDALVKWADSTTEALNQVQTVIDGFQRQAGAVATMLEALAKQQAELAADIRSIDQAHDGIRSDMGRLRKDLGELADEQRRATRRLADEVSHLGSGPVDV